MAEISEKNTKLSDMSMMMAFLGEFQKKRKLPEQAEELLVKNQQRGQTKKQRGQVHFLLNTQLVFQHVGARVAVVILSSVVSIH
ncbi:hypothetical protein CQ007_18630 [Pseudomonas sp. MYb185]|nr:hypothetical protein CQ007_18630 [Pseudomonas sp. MYb185]